MGTGLLADVAVEEVAERAFADETDAGRVFFPGIGQADFFGDAAHLGFFEFADGEQGLRQLGLVEAVQEIALVLERVEPLEQFVAAGGLVQADAGIVAGGDLFSAQPHGVVEKGLELDFGVAEHVGIGRAARLVLAKEFGEHAVLVLRGEVDVFDLDAQHVGHTGRIDEILPRGAELVVVVVFPVLHENTDHLVALLLEQVGGHGRIHAAAEADDDPGGRRRRRQGRRWDRMGHGSIIVSRAGRCAEGRKSPEKLGQGRSACMPLRRRGRVSGPVRQACGDGKGHGNVRWDRARRPVILQSSCPGEGGDSLMLERLSRFEDGAK